MRHECQAMSKIERFEDLIAWKKARELTKAIYELTKQGALSKDFGLSGQLQRSAVSIMANIAEGFERKRRSKFHQFLSIAKSSCAESRSHLYVASDNGCLSPAKFQELLSQAEEVAKIIGGLRSAIAKQRDEDK